MGALTAIRENQTVVKPTKKNGWVVKGYQGRERGEGTSRHDEKEAGQLCKKEEEANP